MTIVAINHAYLFNASTIPPFDHTMTVKYALEKGIMLMFVCLSALAYWGYYMFSNQGYPITFTEKFFLYGTMATVIVLAIVYIGLRFIPYSERF